ncbi:MAG: hypothetical protein A2556_02580 [Candidatus Vogelbacteria bacterium RIFOXYD2_FULL_44_9]|uniref:Uncharacterized protein n=1 Tax=Candidatus Vogelbacteria bacterium RIFOXYD2_FULL_44_9 TaxID=1802441 RepID=A0A1G2QJR8_9BACT|nr:MAG: hypothetical protein A2556_02580 [Candidatus Vogelbacteria bacterium RIFOXYD2_FULL_44_9]
MSFNSKTCRRHTFLRETKFVKKTFLISKWLGWARITFLIFKWLGLGLGLENKGKFKGRGSGFRN